MGTASATRLLSICSSQQFIQQRIGNTGLFPRGHRTSPFSRLCRPYTEFRIVPIVCRNEAEAEKDRRDREAIIAALDVQLKKGDKALIGNSAYRRFLRKSVDRPTKGTSL